MTIFTSSFDGCEPEGSRFGIRIIREGGKYSVYNRARRYVKRRLYEYDIIIDEINTVPFRIYKVAKEKRVVAVIHQLAKEVWFYETRFPVSMLGYFILEPLWLRGYRRVPVVTVSDSTRGNLLEMGFEHVQVVHNGVGTTPLKGLAPKESNPVLIFVGRLVKCKLPDHAIAAFKHVRTVLPEAELWIVGDGYLRAKLERNAEDGVRFLGRIGEEEKFDLLKRAHVLLAPSVREGWGISVIEANAMGTPAVGYAVPGLRDSILDGVTGLLVRPMSTTALAEAARQILCNPLIAEKFSQNSLEWSRKFTWDDSARKFQGILDLGVHGT